jgi:hypothetical protein
MKRGKILAVLLLVVAFALFFGMRPVRERACPLAQAAIASDPAFVARCADTGGVVKDGTCTCPE